MLKKIILSLGASMGASYLLIGFISLTKYLYCYIKCDNESKSLTSYFDNFTPFQFYSIAFFFIIFFIGFVYTEKKNAN